MGVRLTCDAPDCTRSAEAQLAPGGLTKPEGWWLMRQGDAWRCACSTAHLNLALGITNAPISGDRIARTE